MILFVCFLYTEFSTQWGDRKERNAFRFRYPKNTHNECTTTKTKKNANARVWSLGRLRFYTVRPLFEEDGQNGAFVKIEETYGRFVSLPWIDRTTLSVCFFFFLFAGGLCIKTTRLFLVFYVRATAVTCKTFKYKCHCHFSMARLWMYWNASTVYIAARIQWVEKCDFIHFYLFLFVKIAL